MRLILFLFGSLGMLPISNFAQYRQLFPESSKLGPGVNSSFAESHPIISPDGRTLYFSRKNHPQNLGEENLEDIWVSYLEADSSWSKAVNIGLPLNNKEANSVVGVDPSGNVLFLTDVYHSDQKESVAVSRLVGRSWSQPERLPIEDFYNQSKQSAFHVSVDGSILMMSVEREEGFGGRDLYVSFGKPDGEWTKPLNLGPAINTVGEEGSVFLAADAKTIFFSSDWHSSFGGFDIFVSRRLDDSWTNWSQPKNLGRGINTPADDCCFSLPASADSIFFASNSGGDNSDLFRADLSPEFRPEPVLLFKGTVISAESRKPLEAKLIIRNIADSENFKRLNTKKNGSFELVLPYGSDMSIVGEKVGYFAICEFVELGEPLEEPDFSPFETMASGNADSLKYSKLEIDKLQVRVNGLDLKMKGLETARNKIRQKNLLPLPLNSFSTDPKLDDLRDEFNNRRHPKKAIPSEISKTGEFTAKGTTELGRLPQKIDTSVRWKGVDTLSSRRILQGTKSPNREVVLAEMKRNYFRSKGLEVPSALKESEEALVNISKPEKHTFEDMESHVFWILEKENYVEIKKDLQKDLLGQVKEKLYKQLNARERKFFKNSDFDNQLHSSLSEAIKEEVQQRFSEMERLEPQSAWEKKMEEEMKKILSKEIKAQMRRNLKEEVRNELALELEYALTKERQTRLREELAAKLQKEKLTEQKRKKIEVRRNPPPKEKKGARVFREIDMNIEMAPIKPGQIIQLNSVFFEVNKTILKPASYDELNRILTLLQTHPGLMVEFGVHTNGDCTYSFAEELTSGRAAVLADFFIKNGIPKNQIQSKGYGRTKPIASNSTLMGRKKNQRVELTILKTE